jgi:outer membrane protein OmpA-like peptidoglycan-associated protein
MVSISDVVFGVFAEAESTREAGKVAGVLLAYPGLNIEVSGYTDNVGGDAMNQTLSVNRAGSARAYLVQQGVASNSVSARGFGNSVPVAPTTTLLVGSRTGGWNFSCLGKPSAAR